jgi:hypothetical protein
MSNNLDTYLKFIEKWKALTELEKSGGPGKTIRATLSTLWFLMTPEDRASIDPALQYQEFFKDYPR